MLWIVAPGITWLWGPVNCEVSAVCYNQLLYTVRAVSERSNKHIEDSVHLPLNRLKRQLDDVPRDRTVILQCAGGYRSAIAASILANHGRTEIADLVGGLAAWEEAGLDLVAPVAT